MIMVLAAVSLILNACTNHSQNHASRPGADPIIHCAYDPQSKQPNPLGMRSVITVTESAASTFFVYERSLDLLHLVNL